LFEVVNTSLLFCNKSQLIKNSMQIKICGITQPDQAQAIARLGASALGFICVAESPRYVTPNQIRSIVAALPNETGSTIDRVGVFVDTAIEEIQQTVKLGNLTVVQLHGSESPQFCQQLRQVLPQVRVIKAFRVRDSATLAQTIPYQTAVEALLLDAYHPAAHPGLYGGTGQTLDWHQLQQFRPQCPWFLAGGITPANVQDALTLIQPDGLDVSSGVESAPGQKDLQKVADLFSQLDQIGCLHSGSR
jgi:phosphoribosylanthranilate isomerase